MAEHGDTRFEAVLLDVLADGLPIPPRRGT